ncbi:MAG TPA: hypothetical protein VN648_31040 [Candidatus Methylomirabilis sp.]|nr:hypothetical protein [Candidatus Methylomirabilis sp.]
MFRPLPLKYSGNGKTKDSAIYFVNARTYGEHLQMQDRFLEEKNIKVLGARRGGGLEAGHIYDVYPTSNGELWFRVPSASSLDPGRSS